MEVLFPNENVIVTKYFDVSQDREIPIPGFFICAPLRKLSSLEEFTDEEAKEFVFLLRFLRKGMREVLGIEHIYLFQNEDTAHNFHLRIFPRLARMESFGRKIESVRPIMLYAKEHMKTPEVFDEVRKYVERMRIYMTSFSY